MITKEERLIYTMASLAEIVKYYGEGVLERIYRGTFDEADISPEKIPEEYRDKVNLSLLCDEFFGGVIFLFQLTDDYECACLALETWIRKNPCSKKENNQKRLMYQGVRLIHEKKLPGEIVCQLQKDL